MKNETPRCFYFLLLFCKVDNKGDKLCELKSCELNTAVEGRLDALQVSDDRVGDFREWHDAGAPHMVAGEY